MPNLNKSLLDFCFDSLNSSKALDGWKKLYVGVDLGTTNIVVVVLNERGIPIATSMTSSAETIRDGVVVDYWRAIQEVKNNIQVICSKLDISFDEFSAFAVGAAAYPPGVHPKTAQVCANVVEAIGIPCMGLYEEPVAAANAIDLRDGVLVDIGGGTTGIAVLEGGELVYSADEPTGGTHMTLVISGRLGIPFEEAEMMKRDRSKHRSLKPMLIPVLEKMATIVKKHLSKISWHFNAPIFLVGGGADIEGAEGIFTSVIGYPVKLAKHCLLVTPLGIALTLWREQEKQGRKEIASAG